MNSSKIKYYIPNYIYYRTYDKITIIYNTYSHTYFKFTNSIGIILDLIKQGKCKNEIIDAIAEKFNVNKQSITEDIENGLTLLINEKIIFSLAKSKVTLEEQCVWEFAKSNQLYDVLFEITYKCNEHCKHCYVCNNNMHELSLAEINNILDGLRKLNVMTITLTGGEVASRKDFLDIFNLAVEKGFAVDIYTNGVLFDDYLILEIARKHPRSIHFSIYSKNPEKHDYITQVSGSFNKTIAVAKKFIDLGIAVNFKTVLLSTNYDEILDIIDYAENLGATIQIGTVLRTTLNGGDKPFSLKVSDKIFSEVMPRIYERLDNEQPDVVGKRPLSSRICSAGYSSISINPYGEVYACSSLPIVMGNLRKNSIEDIWYNSHQLKLWKDNTFALLKECSSCNHSTLCSFCPGIAMQRSGTPFQRYDDACLNAEVVLKYINNKEV